MSNVVSFDLKRVNLITQVGMLPSQASTEIASVTMVAILATFVSLRSGPDLYGFATEVDTKFIQRGGHQRGKSPTLFNCLLWGGGGERCHASFRHTCEKKS